MTRVGAIVLAATLLLAGCSDGGEEEEIDHETCFGDETALVPGLAQLGEMGNLKVHVLDWNPDPLVIGNNDFSIRVTDSSDTPVEASLDLVETWQRVHDHGTPITPTVTPGAGAGELEVEDMNVLHRGSWLFRFAPSTASSSDFVEFNFAVECLVTL